MIDTTTFSKETLLYQIIRIEYFYILYDISVLQYILC